jgi:SAM-dependent methyltransferase
LTVSEPDRYLLGDSAAELEHLVSQAEVYAEETQQLLDRIPLARGAAAIDVGCGVLGVLHLLRERVGPTGRVVGVDREPRMVAAARALTTERDLSVEVIEDDATQLSLASDTFDLVHERTVLLNVSEPERVVAEMVRIAKPGGVVAIQEGDSAGWVCDPPHPAFSQLRDELLQAYLSDGKIFDRGRMAARLLRDEGLTDVQVRATARVTRPGDFYQTFLLTLTSLVREVILAGGRLTGAEFDRLAAELREHLNKPGTLTCQPTMWQAWGVKDAPTVTPSR